MIVVLDTDVLYPAPLGSHPFWRLMGSRPAKWGIRVVLPWTVMQELAEKHRREFREAHSKFRAAVTQAQTVLGVPVTDPSALIEISDALVDLDGRLEAQLVAHRAEILPVPGVPHEEFVERAIRRIRPCDAKGDGYRDTLNWFTVLEVAEAADENEQVLWVTKNHKDFAADPGSTPRVLHPHLQRDLRERAPHCEVRYFENLDQVRDHVISEHAIPASGDEQQQAARSLRVAELVQEELNTLSVTARVLDPVECGLPLRVRYDHGVLVAATDVEPAAVTDLGDGASELPFTAEFTASVRMMGSSRADGSEIDLSPDGEPITKVLVATGTATCDPGGTIISSVVIDSVTALEDDPQVIANRKTMARMASTLEAFAQIVNSSVDWSKTHAAIAQSLEPLSASLRKIRETTQPFNLDAAVAFPPRLIEQLRQVTDVTHLINSKALVEIDQDDDEPGEGGELDEDA